MKKKILFLCTGNSCRSQMAEGFMRHKFGSDFEVYSAGTQPTPVNSNAVAAMKELGIDISRQRSKSIEELREIPFDIVVTVCDNAKESCPSFPAVVKKIHWSFKDPAKAKGSEDAVFEIFRKVRDQIGKKIENEFSF